MSGSTTFPPYTNDLDKKLRKRLLLNFNTESEKIYVKLRKLFIMDTILYLFAFSAVLLGILGSFLPVLPGPPLAYLGLICLYFIPETGVSGRELGMHGVVVSGITLLDYYIPIWGTKQFGGSKSGVRGAMMGLVIGLFFAPLGILLGPFLGAFLGELIAGSSQRRAWRAALGSFLGFLAGTILKLAYAFFILWMIISSLW